MVNGLVVIILGVAVVVGIVVLVEVVVVAVADVVLLFTILLLLKLLLLMVTLKAKVQVPIRLMGYAACMRNCTMVESFAGKGIGGGATMDSCIWDGLHDHVSTTSGYVMDAIDPPGWNSQHVVDACTRSFISAGPSLSIATLSITTRANSSSISHQIPVTLRPLHPQ